MSSPLFLSDVVHVRARYTRSVHLQRDSALGDSAASAATSNGYRLTPSAFHLLDAVAGAWKRPADRAITLVGPYGAGKSAFAVFLAGLVAGNQAETQLLRDNNAELSEQLSAPTRRLLPIPIVGARAPLGRALVAGLRATIETAHPQIWGALCDEPIWNDPAPASSHVVALIERASLAKRRSMPANCRCSCPTRSSITPPKHCWAAGARALWRGCGPKRSRPSRALSICRMTRAPR